jgi:glycosyltransferase involved in cell wall biosynthesis
VTSSCLVIIPALNEELSVGMVVRRTVESGFSCLVVDDGSRDNTADVARRAGAHVVTMPINLGIGGALRCGFRWAVAHDYHSVVQCDADGQHSPDLISQLVTTQES